MVRLAMGDALCFLLAVLLVLDFAMGNANSFAFRVAKPGTSKHCATV
jgi:hypothetical protein